MAMQISDGGYIVTGTTNSGGAGGYDGFLARLDDAGSPLWERTYGTSSWDLVHGLDVLADGFVMTGQTYSSGDGSGDMWLVRTDLEGEELWSRTFDSPGQDEGRSVRTTSDGGFIVAGSTSLDGDDPNVLVVRYDQAGNEVWHSASGGPGVELGYSVDALNDGGFVVVGYTTSFSARRQMFMARYDAGGSELWSRAITGSGNDWEARAVRELSDGNFAVAGYTKEYGAGGKDCSLLFTDPGGNFISGPTYGGTADDEAWSLDLTDDGGYLIAGSTKSYGPGIEAMFVIRSDGDTLNGSVVTALDPLSVPSVQTNDQVLYHPNPIASGGVLTFSGSLSPTSAITLLDVQGRIVSSLRMNGPSVVIPQLHPGLYCIRYSSPTGGAFNGRLVIE